MAPNPAKIGGDGAKPRQDLRFNRHEKMYGAKSTKLFGF